MSNFRPIVCWLACGVFALPGAPAQDYYIDDGTTLWNPTLSTADPPYVNVYIGDGVGAPDSAVLNINSGMAFSRAFHAILESDGLLLQGNNRLVRITALSGAAGEFRLNAPVPQGNDILGTGPDATFGGTITGGAQQDNYFRPDGGSRLTKSGPSTQTLSGANTYNSRTFITGGVLRVTDDAALGAGGASGNAAFTFGTGTLELAGSITLGELLYLNGVGSGGVGTLRSASGNNTIAAPVQIGWSYNGTGQQVAAEDARIGVESGSTLEITGEVTGANALDKSGGGTLRLSGNNPRTGATSVSGGTLALASASGDAISGSAVTVNSGGTLMLEAANQIADSTALDLAGGTFSTGMGYSETLGPLTLAANSAITLGAASHLLTFSDSSSSVWNPLATLTINGWTGDPETGGADGRIFFGFGGLAASQLQRIGFAGFGMGAALLDSGELVPAPVPETGVLVAALLIVFLAAYREIRSAMAPPVAPS